MKHTEKTPGPHGITLEMKAIPRRTPEMVHEHVVSDAAWNRYGSFASKHPWLGLGPVPNRRARRALGRARGTRTPRPTLVPYEKARASA